MLCALCTTLWSPLRRASAAEEPSGGRFVKRPYRRTRKPRHGVVGAGLAPPALRRNLDGKDKILPVIKQNEHYQEQMLALQQQVEQMAQQLEEAQAQAENLRQANDAMSNSIAEASARTGTDVPSGPEGIPQPEGMDMENPIVSGNANMLGVPTGAALPT